jgi:hypothetical protein
MPKANDLDEVAGTRVGSMTNFRDDAFEAFDFTDLPLANIVFSILRALSLFSMSFVALLHFCALALALS